MADLNTEKLNQEINKITATGKDALALKLDVSDPDSWQKVVEGTIKQFGKIDILVNVAGISNFKDIFQTSVSDWNKIISVDAKGTFLGMKTVAPKMKTNGKGSIVNTSSLAALVAGYGAGDSIAYTAAKGAVSSMTRQAAYKFSKDHIRVNAVCPGPIFTPISMQYGLKSRENEGKIYKNHVMLPPYVGEPKDIAYAFLYFASDESKFVTAESLNVDGGWAENA